MSDVLAIQSFEEAIADIQRNWWIYASMPLIAGFVGWFTKLVALEMLFRPLNFVGIKIGPIPIGWQGIIPMRSRKMATLLCEQIIENLIEPHELFQGLDADELYKEIEKPLENAMAIATQDLALEFFPTLWESMPSAARKLMLRQIKSEVPGLMKEVLDEFKNDVDNLFDIKHMVVTNLEKDKALLVRIVRNTFGPELKKIPVMGFWFGVVVGIVTIPAWAFIHEPLMMPFIGFLNGMISDYIAMQMLFKPYYPKKYFGVFTWHALFLRRYKEMVPEISHLIAEDVLTMDRVMEAALTGPMSDKLVAMMGRHVDRAADDMPGLAKPMVVAAIGTDKWRSMKKTVVDKVIEQAPHTAPHAMAYAKKATGIEKLAAERLAALPNEEVIRIFRPIIHDDEPLIIFLGAVLGGVIGEIQTIFIHTFEKTA